MFNTIMRSIFLIFFLLMTTPVVAQEEVSMLNVEKAIDMALANSKTLEQAKLDIDKSWEQREKASENHSKQLSNTYISSEALYLSLPPTSDAYPVLLRSDRTWGTKQKQYEMEKDSVVFNVYSYYYALLAAEEEVNLLGAVKKKAELNKNIAEIKNKLGMISYTSLTQAKIEYSKASVDLLNASNNLINQYTVFNRLVGLPETSRPVLNKEEKHIDTNIKSLNDEIVRVLTDSPSLWITSENTKMADDLRGYSDTTSIGNIDARKAQLDEEKAREALKTTVQSLYHNIISLEETRTVLMENLKAARENSRIANISYKVGLISLHEKINVDVLLMENEKLINKNSYELILLKLRLEKPWVA